MKRLPRLARLILSQYNAWLVGSAADPNNHNPKDFDIVVSWEDWKHVAMLIPKGTNTTLTIFGGLKCISDGQTVDIWPGNVGDIMLSAKAKYAMNPQLGILLEKKPVENSGY